MYQSLVTLDGNALQNTGAINIVPMLAQNWSISTDGLTYTFNLRTVNFSSGNPFNAYSLWAEFYGLYYLSANNSYWWLDYPVFNMNDSNFGPSVPCNAQPD